MPFYRPPRLLVGFILTAALGCQGHSTGEQHQAIARTVSTNADLIGGPLAQGRAGDFLIKNKHIRAIIQQNSSPTAALGQAGGNLIDLDATRRPNEAGYDHLGELVFWHSLGRGGAAQSVRIVDSGGATGRAIIETMASDVRLSSVNMRTLGEQLNAETPAAILGEFDPAAAVAIDIRTRYILGPDDTALRIETTIINQTTAPLNLPVGDLIWLHGAAQPFFTADQSIVFGTPSQGFGLADRGGEVGYNGVEYVGWQANNVAYAFQPGTAQIAAFAGQSACFTLSGALACLAGAKLDLLSGPVAVANAWPGQDSGFLHVPARGEGVAVYRRLIAAASPDLAAATAALSGRQGQKLSQLSIQASDAAGHPVTNADVAVLAQNGDGLWLPRSVAKANAQGLATLQLPPGADYKLLVQKSGYANVEASRLPAVVAGSTAGGQDEPLVATLGAAGQVEFYSQNDRREPQAARVLILGQDASLERLYAVGDEVLGAADASAHAIYPFADHSGDPLPQAPAGGYAIALSAASGVTAANDDVIALVDTDSAGIARLALDPGDYVAVASRGPGSDITVVAFSVEANQTRRVLLMLPTSIDRFSWIEADWSVRSGNSPGGSLHVDDIATAAAAEGLDVLVVSDRNFVTPVANENEQVIIASGAASYAPGLGAFAAMPMTPLSIPVRSKPATAPGEALEPDSLDGGAPAWFDAASHKLIGLVGWIAQLLNRSDTQGNSVFSIEHPSDFFERIGLSFDFSLGYDAETPSEGAIQTTQAAADLDLNDAAVFDNRFNALQISASQTPAERWLTLNHAFAFWNLGRRTPLLGSSLANQRLRDGVGSVRTFLRHPTGENLIFAPGIADFDSLVRDAALAGHSVVSNGPFATLTVQGVLWDTSDATQPTLLDHFTAVGPGDLLGIARDEFPADDDFELTLTATITIQAAPWVQPRFIELFVNAPYQDPATLAADSDGEYFAAVTSASWTLTNAELAAALTDAEYRVVNADEAITTVTSSAQRYHIQKSYTWTIAGAELLAAQHDLWIAARIVGDRDMSPVVTSAHGAAKAFAIVNPVFVDLGGDIGVDFDTAFSGPCEAADATACPQ